MHCPTGKACFTAAQAQDKARRASARYSQGMTAYRCTECGAWHFGHNDRQGRPMPIVNTRHHLYLEGVRP